MARAFYRDSPILILDESFLESTWQLKRAYFQILFPMIENNIIVSHRSSSFVSCINLCLSKSSGSPSNYILFKANTLHQLQNTVYSAVLILYPLFHSVCSDNSLLLLHSGRHQLSSRIKLILFPLIFAILSNPFCHYSPA